MAQRLISARALADLTGKDVRTVRRWIAAGAVPSVKVGGSRLIPVTAVAALLGLEDVETAIAEESNVQLDFGKA